MENGYRGTRGLRPRASLYSSPLAVFQMDTNNWKSGAWEMHPAEAQGEQMGLRTVSPRLVPSFLIQEEGMQRTLAVPRDPKLPPGVPVRGCLGEGECDLQGP